MKSLKLIVTGYVQRVGYRQVVERIAREMGIAGYVKNLEDGSVEIIAQHADQNILRTFSESINIQKYPIEVKGIRTEEVEAEEYKIFDVILGAFEFEFNERMNEARFALDELHKDNIRTQTELGGKIDGLGGKIDITNNSIQILTTKTDKVADNLNSFANATMQRFDTVDKKYGKVSENLIEISGSLKELVEILKVFKPKS